MEIEYMSAESKTTRQQGHIVVYIRKRRKGKKCAELPYVSQVVIGYIVFFVGIFEWYAQRDEYEFVIY